MQTRSSVRLGGQVEGVDDRPGSSGSLSSGGVLTGSGALTVSGVLTQSNKSYTPTPSRRSVKRRGQCKIEGDRPGSSGSSAGVLTQSSSTPSRRSVRRGGHCKIEENGDRPGSSGSSAGALTQSTPSRRSIRQGGQIGRGGNRPGSGGSLGKVLMEFNKISEPPPDFDFGIFPPTPEGLDTVVPVVEDRKRSKRKKPAGGGGKKKKANTFKIAFTNRRIGKQVSNIAQHIELSKSQLSGLTEEEKLQLSSWGLPKSILAKYKSKGVTSLFPWQLECLGNEKVLEGRNLLYSAPTSAGKTLVAEILMVKRVLELGKKAIMILPFVSVCREKMYGLQEIFGDAGIRVEGFMGAYCPPGGFKAVDIAICTIEKANSLINRLLEENSLSQLGTIVVDELHLIGDSHRGYLLELLLTKIKFMNSKTLKLSDSMVEEEESRFKKLNIQIIGMSATLPNLEVLSGWLDAELIITHYRPVPLVERLLYSDKLFDQELLCIRDVKNELMPVAIPCDDDHIIYLSLETVLNGHSVLIFCPTKAMCEKLSQQIAKSFWYLGSTGHDYCPDVAGKLRGQLNALKIQEVLAQLGQCPGGLDEDLKKAVSYGVAFHHAGLTYDERDIIESAFKRTVLRVIVATSTLSAGVNLPARRVIISSPLFNGSILDVLTYRQMCGRAGRKGVDTEGESILICNSKTKEVGIRLVQSELPRVKSALLGDEGSLTSSMKRALLEVVASGIATLPEEVEAYAKCTLLSRSIDLGLYDDEDLPLSQRNKDDTVKECLKFLEANDFIRLKRFENESKTDEYMATQLGSACLASSLAPDEGITVYKELLKARRCFVLESELHVVYQVTPIYLSDQLRNIVWLDYINIWNGLSPDGKLVAELVGIEESFLMRAMIGSVSWKNPKQRPSFMIHQRFFAALALNDLVNEVPLSEVAHKYSLNKGVVQNLQQSASTFAGMVTAFCSRLGWSNLELLLSQFQERLQFGVQRELCDLVRLSLMNGSRARVLYDNGIKNIVELAAADPVQVEQIFHKAVPFQSSVHGEGQVQRSVWMMGKSEGVSESVAAQNIVDEARQFIQIELGLPENVEFQPLSRIGLFLSPNTSTRTQGRSGQDKKPDYDILGISQSSASESSDQEGNDGKLVPKAVVPASEQNGSVAEAEQCYSIAASESVHATSVEATIPQTIAKPISVETLQTLPDLKHREPEPEVLPEKSSEGPTTITEVKETLKLETRGSPQINDKSIFDDSFPSMSCGQDMFTGLSQGIPDKHDKKGDLIKVQIPQTTDPDLEQHRPYEEKMETSDVEFMQYLIEEMMETSMNISDCREGPDLKTPKTTEKFKFPTAERDSGLKHSTPVLNQELSAFKKRLSAIHPDHSPLFLASSPSVVSSLSEIKQKISFDGSSYQLNDDILAEFDKDFDSVASLMETSLNLGKGEDEEEVNVPREAFAEVNSNPLSDSDRLAMIAVAGDESKFTTESEDMFAEHFDPPLTPLSLMSSVKTSSVLVEGCSTDRENGDSSDTEDTDIFEASEEFDRSKMNSTGSSSSRREATFEPILSTVLVGGKMVKVMKVFAPEFIPEDMFQRGRPVGIGLKLAPEKRPTSIAACGIGSKIIGTRRVGVGGAAPGMKEKDGDQDREHSIALFNGGSTIWVYQWKHWEQYDKIPRGKAAPKSGKINDLLQRLKCCPLVLFDAKLRIRKLLETLGRELMVHLSRGDVWDPKIAQWVWQFDEDGWNVSFDKVATAHSPADYRQLSQEKWSRVLLEAYFSYDVMIRLKERLVESQLWGHFIDVEMPSVFPLMLMELNGFGLDSFELSKMKKVLQFKAALLEIRAFQLAGRQFSLSSPKDIRQVLFRDIGLKQPTKTKGTGKDVLSKLDHELPQLIIEWRKITSALQKVIIPFQQEKNLETGRIHGCYSHFTVTGRVVMSEPSLQCVPRDFDLCVDFSEEEIEDIKNHCKVKFGPKLASLINQIERGAPLSHDYGNGPKNVISMRRMFIPCCHNFVLLSADYSQLELRILAHLCQDRGLTTALNDLKGDVFISIASKWKGLPPEQITDNMRQEAKGIVYGVIYGMGIKTLAEQMEVDEADASRFISEFMKSYPKVRTFLDRTVKLCRANGFVETICGRKRFLPNINSKNPSEKAQAERQAINSQIQGSAADLVKKAMTKIYQRITQLYPSSCVPIVWDRSVKSKKSSGSTLPLPFNVSEAVCFPVLNLHDELIFEVQKPFLKEMVREVRDQMESSLKLSVRLPVVIKVGPSWGTLKRYEE